MKYPFLLMHTENQKTRMHRGQGEITRKRHKLFRECVKEVDKSVLPALTGGEGRRGAKRMGIRDGTINHFKYVLVYDDSRSNTFALLFYQGEGGPCQAFIL
ncbi:hypothetical protein KSC_011930 [Ktedonobacter sp. SOSP1-52]|nr:hypothetical protein KSC_011930 [Ktedonobacter sp. SOSP1-52]